MATPTVSILLPVLDEASHIVDCIASLRSQDYPAIAEILIALAESTDGTEALIDALVAGEPPVIVVPNPDRHQSFGLNRLIERAVGEISIRIDAHTAYAPDYVRHSVAALVGDDAPTMVGGPMVPVGRTPTERAIAAAMSSKWAVGGAAHPRRDTSSKADSVYLGAIRTRVLRDLGGYRHFPSGVAEDADLAFRIRRSGGVVAVDPSIRSWYRPRSTLRSLWRQFLRYGRGKAEMTLAHRRLPTLRPLAPLGLLVGLTTAVTVGLLSGWWWGVIAVGLPWAAILSLAATNGGPPIRTAVAAALMHLSYAIGLARGFITGRRDLARAGVRGMEPAGGDAAHDLDG